MNVVTSSKSNTPILKHYLTQIKKAPCIVKLFKEKLAVEEKLAQLKANKARLTQATALYMEEVARKRERSLRASKKEQKDFQRFVNSLKQKNREYEEIKEFMKMNYKRIHETLAGKRKRNN